tara:strand:+ start:616 stop:801 length:186 start_codon:yes stop_codon:yes gene_type:complete
MAGLLIFIGVGIIVSTILRAQARKRRSRPPSDRLRNLRDSIDGGDTERDTDGEGPWTDGSS